MKTKHSLLILLIFFVSFINSCKTDDNTTNTNDEISPSNSNKMSEILVFPNAKVVESTSLPKSSSVAEAPSVSYFDNNISYTAGSKIIIPTDVDANSKIAGVYIQVKGATKYLDVPINSNTSNGTISLPFDLPSIVGKGSFILILKFYDENKKISSSIEITITVTKADNCGVTKVSGGQGLTSNIFKVPNIAGKQIKISYNTFTVKDKIDIFQNGNWIGGTGPLTDRNTLRKALDCSFATEAKGYVGKKDEFLFNYDPSLGTEIEVVVSGCEDGGTLWEYTFSCPGDFNSTNLNLDGKWLTSVGSGVIISGTTGTFYSFSSSWQPTVDLGLISIGSTKLKDISNISTYKWNCLELYVYRENQIPKSTVWSDDGTITMSNDGKSITISSHVTFNGISNFGSLVWYRQ